MHRGKKEEEKVHPIITVSREPGSGGRIIAQKLAAKLTVEVFHQEVLHEMAKRALRKWINRFNQCGVDGLIVKKRPGRMSIIKDQQAPQLAQLIDEPQQAQRSF